MAHDKAARESAKRIRNEFWRNFDVALAPGRASKQAYLDELEELISDAEGKAACVRDEIKQEEGD